MEPVFQLTWCVRKIADALKIPEPDVREYMTDGRRVSFLIERRLVLMHPGWVLAKSEGAGHDLVDPEGGLWEVRSVTKGGIYFAPSYQVGSGRTFNEEGFLQKVDALSGYIVTDIESFPSMDVFKVPSPNVKRWWHAGKLGTASRVSRRHFLRNLAPDIAGA